MAAQPTTQLQYQTRCRFCGMTPPPQPPFVRMADGSFDPKLIKFAQELQKHIEKHHKAEFAAMVNQLMRFTGFATVGAFEIQDPLLVETQEQIRADLHRRTRKTYISDEHIAAKVEEFGPAEFGTPLHLSATAFVALLRDMRDLLCEEGPYAPATSPAQKPLVSL